MDKRSTQGDKSEGDADLSIREEEKVPTDNGRESGSHAERGGELLDPVYRERFHPFLTRTFDE